MSNFRSIFSRSFQIRGSTTRKARLATVDSLTKETTRYRWLLSAERRDRARGTAAHIRAGICKLKLGTCESAVCVRIESRIESFHFQQILVIKISNYNWSKRDVQNYIFLITIRKIGVWSLIKLASLNNVPLSAVNGLSRLTKLTTSKGQDGRFDSKIFESANPFLIESGSRFEFESNLEASQVTP